MTRNSWIFLELLKSFRTFRKIELKKFASLKLVRCVSFLDQEIFSSYSLEVMQ